MSMIGNLLNKLHLYDAVLFIYFKKKWYRGVVGDLGTCHDVFVSEKNSIPKLCQV